MRKKKPLEQILLGLGTLLLIGLAGHTAEEPELLYPAPVRISAHRLRFERQTVVGGVVLAELELGADGKPRQVTVQYGQSPFREVASSLLREWTFMLPEEAAEDARVAAVFMFRQPQLLAVGSTAQRLPRVSSGGPALPPQARRVVEPSHPVQVVTDGLAVLAVALDETGRLKAISSLFGPSEFLAAARQAVRQWEFEPARQEGEAVEGGLLVVVYFPRPLLGPPPERR